MKLSERVGTMFGTIILVVIAITAGAFVWAYEKSQLAMEEESKAQISNDISTADNRKPIKKAVTLPEEVGGSLKSIPTDNWKLFSNGKNGYSIKYPSNWTYKTKYGQEDGLFLYSNDYKIDELDNNFENLNGDYFVTISVYKGIGTHVSLKEWRKYDGSNYQEMLIKGNEALKFDADGLSGQVRHYYFIKDNDGYAIDISYNNINNIGEKIISTFEFVN